MSYWIEIRCARQKAIGCYSSRQIDTPMSMTRNTSMAAIVSTTMTLSKDAKKLGWKETKEGWICPICIKEIE